MSNKAKVYFPGLNGLRFLAALAVIITHVELFKGRWGYASSWKEPAVFYAGGLGVDFFFVLSGFLITYLLLTEKEVTKGIAIRDFYLRRIFRILPLYYLIVLLSLFVFPFIELLHIPRSSEFLYENFGAKVILFLTIFPNAALATFPPVPYASITWSIGVEEQFYLLWPLVLKFSKRPLKSIIIIIVVFILFKILLWLGLKFWEGGEVMDAVRNFVAMTRMECMAIGGVGAYCLYNGWKQWLNLVYHPLVQIGCLVAIIPLVYLFPNSLRDGMHIVFSILFLCIILNVASNPKSLLKLESRAFRFLGRISYGIYMYHMIAIILTIRLLRVWSIDEYPYWIWSAAVYGISIGLTLLFSTLSYVYFEQKFIAMKHRYTKVRSGDAARSEIASNE